MSQWQKEKKKKTRPKSRCFRFGFRSATLWLRFARTLLVGCVGRSWPSCALVRFRRCGLGVIALLLLRGRTLKRRWANFETPLPACVYTHACTFMRALYMRRHGWGRAFFDTFPQKRSVYDLIERFVFLFGVFLFLFLFLWYGRVVSKSWRGSFGGAVRALFLYARSVWVLALRVSAWLAGRVWGCRD